MKLQIITDAAKLQEPVWLTWKGRDGKYEYADGEERIEFLVLPATKAVIALARERMTTNDPAVYGDGLPPCSDDPSERYFRALFCTVVKEWRNVESDGVAIECTDRGKVFLYEDMVVGIGRWLLDEAFEVAGAKVEDERKN